MALASLQDLYDPSTRVGRALELLDKHGDQIERVAHDLYLVPSCSGRDSYRVRYGGDVEGCECEDFVRHGDEQSCKHLLAMGIASARRRARRRQCS